MLVSPTNNYCECLTRNECYHYQYMRVPQCQICCVKCEVSGAIIDVVDQFGNSLLHLCIRVKRVQQFKYLTTTHGDKMKKFLHAPNADGLTPLLLAVETRDYEMFETVEKVSFSSSQSVILQLTTRINLSACSNVSIRSSLFAAGLSRNHLGVWKCCGLQDVTGLHRSSDCSSAWLQEFAGLDSRTEHLGVHYTASSYADRRQVAHLR